MSGNEGVLDTNTASVKSRDVQAVIAAVGSVFTVIQLVINVAVYRIAKKHDTFILFLSEVSPFSYKLSYIYCRNVDDHQHGPFIGTDTDRTGGSTNQ